MKCLIPIISAGRLLFSNTNQTPYFSTVTTVEILFKILFTNIANFLTAFLQLSTEFLTEAVLENFYTSRSLSFIRVTRSKKTLSFCMLLSTSPML